MNTMTRRDREFEEREELRKRAFWDSAGAEIPPRPNWRVRIVGVIFAALGLTVLGALLLR